MMIDYNPGIIIQMSLEEKQKLKRQIENVRGKKNSQGIQLEKSLSENASSEKCKKRSKKKSKKEYSDEEEDEDSEEESSKKAAKRKSGGMRSKLQYRA